MIIVLMRHGEAEPETASVSNRSRALTEHGRREVKKTAKMLGKLLGGRRVHIWASPYRRTRQTAAIVSEYVDTEGVQVTDKLLQGSWPMTASQIVKEGDPIIMVSHHPFLQSYLLSTASAAIKFQTAAACVIDYDVAWKKGRLIGYLAPALRSIKKE